jgi:hypothetical protein
MPFVFHDQQRLVKENLLGLNLADPVLIDTLATVALVPINVWAHTSIASVREILVLCADRIAAELLRRSPQGEWPERPGAITEGELMLEGIGFRVALAGLYARTGLQRPLGAASR